MLLVMGFGMTGAMWGPLVPHLSSDYQVAVYDHPGTGPRARHTPEPSPRSMLGLCLAAVGVLDALSWEKAHIVGVSMGGMISQELAIRFPERVLSLSLLATHAGGPGAVVPTLPGLMVLAAPRGQRWKLAHLLYPSEYRRAHAHVVSQRTEEQLAQYVPRDAIRAQLTAVLRHDTRARLSSVRAPALVVEAALDRLIRPALTRDIARRIPGARLVRLPDAGHGLVVQEAERLAALLREHLSQGR